MLRQKRSEVYTSVDRVWKLSATYLVFAQDDKLTVSACNGAEIISAERLADNAVSAIAAALAAGDKPCPP